MSRNLVLKFIAYPTVVLKRRVYRHFIERLSHVEAAQRAKLAQLLAQVDGSAFARDHGLSGVRTIEALRQALPIAPYERMQPYIERVKAGETTALFRPGTRLKMFATTSGTTAAAKFIPVTTLTVREYLYSWTVWGSGVALDYPDIPSSGVINMTSSWRTGATPSGIPFGSVTGMLSESMHRFMKRLHAVPPLVSQISDVDRRYYLTLRLGIARQDTMMLTAANPGTLINLAHRLREWSGDLIRDLHDGTLRHHDAYPVAVTRTLGRTLRRRHVVLARRLETLANAAGGLTPRQAWPRLTLIGVWTGGTLAAYLPRLRELYQGVTLRDHGLSASEGRITLPLADGVDFGVVNLDGGFFEFVPEGDLVGRHDALTAYELTAGRRYTLAMTTSGGLIRYDLGDVVECVGHQAGAPLLRFLNKGLHVANVTGEKLGAAQVTNAVSRAFAALGLSGREYIVTPAYGEPPGYHLLIENQALPPGERIASLLATLDEQLCAANIEYAERRLSRRLAQIVLTPVADGTFAALREAKVKAAGTAVEHYKHPFLVVDPNFITQVRSSPLSDRSA